MKKNPAALMLFVGGFVMTALVSAAPVVAPPLTPEIEKQFRSQLDAPLLFVKRYSYTGIHIYDTFYKWPPGGGGIYVLENPSAPRDQWRIRPLVDETTPGTPGHGVYTHPELSWDAKKVLFCFKGEANGSTSIYEIRIDGTGLRRVTDPTPACAIYKGGHGGQHDIAPAYLPDGRIVFLSTRPSGLVPCANAGVSILHVMNADGSDMHPISVNNVNEFDPSVLPDGRILFGRWEYVDKNALTIQSLWTINPDGTQETALYANNMVFPESVLDARPVPGSHLIVGTLAKHNSTPRGSIGFIDPLVGKNDPKAITNIEHPDDPIFDKGDSCEPWPLSENLVLFSGRPAGQKRNALEMMDRAGHRFVLMSDPQICLHSPMLVKPRPEPKIIADSTNRGEKAGRFFVQDIYQGLQGVKRGDIKWLRVIEETSRVSGRDGGTQPYNQTFLVSAALAFSVKNFLGMVPVNEDGSVYFEVPSGRAVYFQALDGDGRLVHSMRTFVQAAPGTTRSCIGCHEYKYGTASPETMRRVLARGPARLQPESWGTGYMDYPTMIQPLLDKHCASCHGGEKGFGGGIDLTGGWTEHFSISYENLANRRETQLVAYWIAGIDCMNGTAHWSSQIFQPRSHGSGAAPLAKLLLDGHGGRIAGLTRAERDLLMAWMDSNGLYHGTWDSTQYGCQLTEWQGVKKTLMTGMKQAGCVRCHGAGFESDWFNLQRPELSRILRAPLPPGADGFGLGLCRDRKVDPKWHRVRLLWNGYAHAVKPLDAFAPVPFTPPDMSGAPLVSFASTGDTHYQTMLASIRNGRERALLTPRVDMPGAEILSGACRQFNPPMMPDPLPPLQATLGDDGVVQLAWERSARTIGLEAEVHRSIKAGFTPGDSTLLTRTGLASFMDTSATAGRQNYAIVFTRGSQRSQPVYAALDVPPPVPPSAPAGFTAASSSGCVRLRWQSVAGRVLSYNVYRARRTGVPHVQSASNSGQAGRLSCDKLTAEPIRSAWFTDGTAEPQVEYAYTVRAVSQHGLEGEPTPAAVAAARLVKEPVFTAAFDKDTRGRFDGGEEMIGEARGGARIAGGVLDLTRGGHVAFPHREQFDLSQPLTVELWVNMEAAGQMPIPVSCGLWNQAGWFLQRIGGRWRWHVGGLDCDGGKPVAGQWMHVVCTYDGHIARVFQDGVQVAEKAGSAVTLPWSGDLLVGHYSGMPKDAAFQVAGRIAGLKIYHRAFTATEAAATAKAKPPASGPVAKAKTK
ncbi:MAG: LamG-like jellyroll fold domain-containing protein [Verrucomicrobiia bacterium]